MPTSQSDFPGIPETLLPRLREVLLRCPALESDRALKAIFVDARLDPWKHRVHQVSTVAGRVDLLIDQLHDQWDTSSQCALVLLLRVLEEMTAPGDSLREELAALALELAGGDPAATLPHDPQARLKAMPTDHVPEVSLALSPGSRMPLRPNPLFVGREEELKALARAIKGEGSTAVLAQATTVTGIGGMGKPHPT